MAYHNFNQKNILNQSVFIKAKILFLTKINKPNVSNNNGIFKDCLQTSPQFQATQTKNSIFWGEEGKRGAVGRNGY